MYLFYLFGVQSVNDYFNNWPELKNFTRNINPNSKSKLELYCFDGLILVCSIHLNISPYKAIRFLFYCIIFCGELSVSINKCEITFLSFCESKYTSLGGKWKNLTIILY